MNLSVRIINIDYYLSKPHPQLDQCTTEFSLLPFKVPIIRIFGSTLHGQKTCIHIHQVYPYVSVPYEGKLDDCEKYIQNLGRAINKAVDLSFGNDSQVQTVLTIKLVRGIQFYGFESGYRYFLKIYLLNPSMQSRVVGLLEEGNVIGYKFMVYEHYLYLQQFMIDYNLAGMNFVHLSYYKHRFPILDYARPPSPFHLLTSNVPLHDGWTRSDRISRISFSELEIDSWASEILNREQVEERPMHAVRPSVLSERLVPSLAAVWEDERERRVERGLPAYEVPEEGRESQRRERQWENEARLRATFEETLKSVSSGVPGEVSGGVSSGVDGFGVSGEIVDDAIMTSFQAVSCLHPSPPHRIQTTFENHEVELSSGDEEMVEALDWMLSTSQPKQSQILSTSQPKQSQILLMSQTKQSQPIEAVAEFESELEVQVKDGIESLIEEYCQKSQRLSSFGYLDTSPIPIPPTSPLPTSTLLTSPLPTSTLMTSPILKSTLPKSSLLTSPLPTSALMTSPLPTRIYGRGPLTLLLSSSSSDEEPVAKRIKLVIESSSSSSSVSEDDIAQYKEPVTIDGELEYFVEAISDQRPGRDGLEYLVKWLGYGKEEWLAYELVKDTEALEIYLASLSVHLPVPFRSLLGFEPVTLVAKEKKEQRFEPVTLVAKEKEKEGFEPVTLVPLGTPKEKKEEEKEIEHKSLEEKERKDSLVGFEPKSLEGKEKRTKRYTPLHTPPHRTQLVIHPSQLYPPPFYSNAEDIPDSHVQFAGREFRVVGADGEDTRKKMRRKVGLAWYVSVKSPVSNMQALSWLESTYETKEKVSSSDLKSSIIPSGTPKIETVGTPKIETVGTPEKTQETEKTGIEPERRAREGIEGPTPRNKYNFKFSQSQDSRSSTEMHLKLMSLEVHVHTTTSKVPDPENDRVMAIFYSIQTDGGPIEEKVVEGEEVEVLKEVIRVVKREDPDVLVGWEVMEMSWGYLIQRAKLKYRMDLSESLSRIYPEFTRAHSSREDDTWGALKQSSIHIPGRIILNVWRLMRSDLTLLSYTFHNVVFHVLHMRVPKFTFIQLSHWYASALHSHKTRLYYKHMATLTLNILTRTELISQTSEFAKVYGIDFYSVLVRGSQFKVESVMARIARPENFMLYSPSRPQVATMRAPECLALNMEPRSDLYTSPVLVLDFQSLYPSIMIGYNYCYSTLLGTVERVGTPEPLGAKALHCIPPQTLLALKDHVTITPNGIVFAKSHIRQGVLGRMVSEILATRVMVKSSMKLYKDDKALTRVLQAKQLGLKLLANVTFGYTSASYSGRMPCVLISDAIIQTGRVTLERGIEVIHSNKEWNAKVVYGDTDSLFVSLEGASRSKAFELGAEIVERITHLSPQPMNLQFEKVYHPCMLLAKKRYVGFKYESSSDLTPVFDAKGIETVRRDNCPAVGKCVETCLKILFRSQDLSLIKSYLYRQWTRILTGKVSIQDFIIAKEVKMGTYSKGRSLPPGAHLGARRMQNDHRAEPEHGDRVPYVVVYKGEKARLIDSVVSPEELLNDQNLRLNGEYYITKQIIAPLARILNLVGADVERWYMQMPKVTRLIEYSTEPPPLNSLNYSPSSQRIIEHFYKSTHCLICARITNSDICPLCTLNAQHSIFTLASRVRERQDRFQKVDGICRSCTLHSGLADVEVKCVSIECPVWYERVKVGREARSCERLIGLMDTLDKDLSF